MAYFSRKSSYGKGKIDQTAQAAAAYQMTPLFFQETLETTARYDSNDNDENSLDFDDNPGEISQRSISSVASSKYRDTNIDQNKASQIIHGQSLASIINNPKKDSFMSKVKTLVKQKVTGTAAPKFKQLKESQIEDSQSIPKVNPEKDFKEY